MNGCPAILLTTIFDTRLVRFDHDHGFRVFEARVGDQSDGGGGDE